MAGNDYALDRAHKQGDEHMEVDRSERPIPGAGDQCQWDGMCDISDVALVATAFQPRLGASEWPVVSERNSPCLRRLKKTYSR